MLKTRRVFNDYDSFKKALNALEELDMDYTVERKYGPIEDAPKFMGVQPCRTTWTLEIVILDDSLGENDGL